MHHMLLFNGGEVIGVVVSDVTLSDDGIEYTCTTSGAALDFKSSLTRQHIVFSSSLLIAAYQQPFVAIPSEVCEGDAVTLRCEISATAGNISALVAAIIARDGDVIESDTPNNMLLFSGIDVIGVVVSDVTLSDDGVEYTYTTSGAALDFKSSLTLNVAGMYVCTYIAV